MIRIKNLGLTARPLKRSLESSEAEPCVHCVADLPREYRSAMPVHDRDEVTVPLRHRDMGDVGAPHFVHNPLSPHSAPVRRRLQSPPAKRKFLAEDAGSGFQLLVVSTNGAKGNYYFSVRVVGADS